MSEVYIPKIRPVRVKTEEISQNLINPGSMGHNFPDGAGPRAVYLDQRYDYPDDRAVDGLDAERQRQNEIWQQVDSDGAFRFLDRQVEDGSDRVQMRLIREAAHALVGTRSSAEFYQLVFSELMGQTMNVVLISTGMRPYDGENYHDIAYLPE